VLTTITNIFKVPDLRKKILYTLGMVALYRLGTHIQVPGVDAIAVQQFTKSAQEQGTIGLLNLFSGGALSQFAIFALGIMPYITASIIIQILGVVIPKLEEWQNSGAVGQRKITQWTRYVALSIALLQATGLTFLFGRGTGATLLGGGQQAFDTPLIPGFGLWRVAACILSLVGGTALLMWMGELITQRGIGNGMSMIIFASVVSSLPFDYYRILKEKHFVTFAVLLGFSILTLVAIVFMENGQRRIPVQFAKRVVGRKMVGGQSNYIPLKVNTAGVVPIIFASSVLLLPAIVTNVWNWAPLQDFVSKYLQNSQSFVYIAVFGALIIGFTYFYNAIAFDPIKQADQIRKQGGFIPGIRPGAQTESHLAKIVNRITLPGAIFIAAIALIPSVIMKIAGVTNFPFGGTSVLIAVGVALETMKQIDSQLMLRNYEGFLK
jgi:preprotein translocase subunit SecY